jgi:Zn-finger nucleic acid-binding protein
MDRLTCPTCRGCLEKVELDGRTVDRCPSCNGIYLEAGQLESVVHIVKLLQSVRLAEEDIDTITEEERRRRLRCPKDGKKMMKTPAAGLTVDVCRACGGMWLDDGEITALKMAETHIRGNIQLYIRLGR